MTNYVIKDNNNILSLVQCGQPNIILYGPNTGKVIRKHSSLEDALTYLFYRSKVATREEYKEYLQKQTNFKNESEATNYLEKLSSFNQSFRSRADFSPVDNVEEVSEYTKLNYTNGVNGFRTGVNNKKHKRFKDQMVIKDDRFIIGLLTDAYYSKVITHFTDSNLFLEYIKKNRSTLESTKTKYGLNQAYSMIYYFNTLSLEVAKHDFVDKQKLYDIINILWPKLSYKVQTAWRYSEYVSEHSHIDVMNMFIQKMIYSEVEININKIILKIA